MCLAVGCGGRTSLDSPVQFDAAPPLPDTSYKVAFQEAITPGPALVWHSRDATISPLGYDHIGPFTYDGNYMTVWDKQQLTVLDRNASIVRQQPFPQGASPEVLWPRSDASRIVLTSSSGAITTFATLDADGTYAVIASGNYGYAKYGPDDSTLIFRSGNAIWSMKDDGSAMTQLVASSREIEDVAFSYDQARVAFTSDPPINSFTSTISVFDGTSLTEYPLPGIEAVFQPSFVPDGSGVVFFGWKGDWSSVFFVDLRSQSVTTLVPNVGGGYHIEGVIAVAHE